METQMTDFQKAVVEFLAGRTILAEARSNYLPDGGLGDTLCILTAEALVLGTKGFGEAPAFSSIPLSQVSGIEVVETRNLDRYLRIDSTGGEQRVKIGLLDLDAMKALVEAAGQARANVAAVPMPEPAVDSSPVAAPKVSYAPKPEASTHEVWRDPAPVTTASAQVSDEPEMEAPAAESALAEPGQRLCPLCQVRMEERDQSGVTVDQCPSCKGVYLDAGEIEALTGADDISRILARNSSRYAGKCPMCTAPVHPLALTCPSCDTRTSSRCPGCAGLMRVTPCENILVDICTSCMGLWLDRGELEFIQSQLEQKTRPAPEPKEPEPDRKALRQALEKAESKAPPRIERKRKPEPPAQEPAEKAIPALECGGCGKTIVNRRDAYFTEDGVVCEACYASEAREEFLGPKESDPYAQGDYEYRVSEPYSYGSADKPIGRRTTKSEANDEYHEFRQPDTLGEFLKRLLRGY